MINHSWDSNSTFYCTVLLLSLPICTPLAFFIIYQMGRPTAQAFSRWPGFDPRPVRVGFAVDKVALEKIFLQVIGLSPCQT